MTKWFGISIALLTVLLVAAAASSQVGSQDKPQGKPQGQPAVKEAQGQPSMEELMAKWAELNAMGPEHEKFKEMVGKWDAESKMWVAPNTQPTVSKGTAEYRLILGGRYVEQKFTCDMNGQPFEGLSIFGYDRIKKKYVSIWMDNMCTGIMLSEGIMDATGKICTYYGTSDDPLTGELDKMCKEVVREVSKDEVVFEMYEMRGGVGEVKMMEITYKRKK
jgi:hypothetical protein